MTTRKRLSLTLYVLGVLPGVQGFAQSVASLSLQEAIDRGLSRSPTVQRAEADLQSQVERKRGAWSNLGPKAAVSYNETYFEDKQFDTQNGGGALIRDDVTKNGSLTVTQPITGLYGLVEYGRLSSLQVDLSEEGLRKAKRDAGFGAAEAYLQAFQTQEQELIAEQSIAAAKSAYQDALALQRVGRLSQGDVLKFQLALSRAESSAAQARAAKQIAFSNLRLAIQLPRGENVQLMKELPSAAEDKVELNQAIEAAKNRPEWRQATLGSELADFSKKLAYAKLIPNVNVFAKVDKNFGDVTRTSGPKENQYYGISVQWDIWNNGSSFFEIREASAQKLATEAGLAGVQDLIALDVTTAWESYLTAKESLQLAKTAVVAADEAYRIDQTRFRNGQVSTTDLIRSETEKTTAQGNLINAQTQVLLWHFRLQKATGQDQPKL
jgi:outer membrane protein